VLSLFTLKPTMSKHGFPFLGSKESAKFIMSRFDFSRLLREPYLPPPRPLPPNWLSLCPRFMKTRVECYAHDIGVLEILQFGFYCSVHQEAIRFNIVTPLVAQDLTKSLEEFNWKIFEVARLYQHKLNRMSRQRIT